MSSLSYASAVAQKDALASEIQDQPPVSVPETNDSNVTSTETAKEPAPESSKESSKETSKASTPSPQLTPAPIPTSVWNTKAPAPESVNLQSLVLNSTNNNNSSSNNNSINSTLPSKWVPYDGASIIISNQSSTPKRKQRKPKKKPSSSTSTPPTTGTSSTSTNTTSSTTNTATTTTPKKHRHTPSKDHRKQHSNITNNSTNTKPNLPETPITSTPVNTNNNEQSKPQHINNNQHQQRKRINRYNNNNNNHHHHHNNRRGNPKSFPQYYNYNPQYAYYPYNNDGRLFAINSIAFQLDYYFTISNLLKDIYLRKHMNSNGWIDLSFISKFKRIENFSLGDSKLIYDALLICKNIEFGLVDSNVEDKENIENIKIRPINDPLNWILKLNDREGCGLDDTIPVVEKLEEKINEENNDQVDEDDDIEIITEKTDSLSVE